MYKVFLVEDEIVVREGIKPSSADTPISTLSGGIQLCISYVFIVALMLNFVLPNVFY